MSPFEPLSPNFNTLYCEATDWLKMSTPNMHWFQLFRRGQKCNLWIPLSRTYTMRFWGRLFAVKMVVLSIFKHVTDCFNSELKGKFQALISIVFLFQKGQKIHTSAARIKKWNTCFHFPVSDWDKIFTKIKHFFVGANACWLWFGKTMLVVRLQYVCT